MILTCLLLFVLQQLLHLNTKSLLAGSHSSIIYLLSPLKYLNEKCKLVKLIHKQAGAMKKETGVESPMLDDNEVRQYIDLVIRETRGKKDDRTVGA